MNLESLFIVEKALFSEPLGKPQVAAAGSSRKATVARAQGAVYLGLNAEMFALHLT